MYQIKSTPFFRRMLTTSKRNGELQRLKDEFDRIKEFNDRSIEMKMRKVRLKRLFREIEEIKHSTPPTKWRRLHRFQERSPEEQRRLNIKWSRQLGAEYSRTNGIKNERPTAHISKAVQMCSTAAILNAQQARERRMRAEMRVAYGNNKSLANIKKFAMTAKKSHRENKTESVMELDKTQRLRHRLNYGNSWSTINMSKNSKLTRKLLAHKSLLQPETRLPMVMSEVELELPMEVHLDENLRAELAGEAVETTDDAGAEVEMEVEAEADEPMRDEIERSESETYIVADEPKEKSSVTSTTTHILRNFQNLDRKIPISVYDSTTVEESNVDRARRRWRKLSLVSKNRFDTSRHHQRVTEDPDEFCLRTISNDMNLPMSRISMNRFQVYPEMDDREEDDYKPEKVVRVQNLRDDLLTRRANVHTSLNTETSSKTDSNISAQFDSIPSQEVSDIVHHFEDSKQKFTEFSVRDLRAIFESIE